ncbi:MAG TPA: hypothetical protein VFT45_14255 [Longimicrobium sp.]|nr:hypothetical protein [Longimicrobium sp.]
MIRILPARRMALSMALALAASAACDDYGPAPTDTSPGAIEVVVNATGTSLDQQFIIQLNGGEELVYVSGTPFLRENLPTAVYTVRISGIASNCTLQGGDTVQVPVYAGQRAKVTFNLTCQTVAG